MGPFHSLLLQGEKLLNSHTWLRKSRVLPPLGQGAKLARKIPFRGQYCQMCDFGLRIVIFVPFPSLLLWGKKILTFQTWLKKSLVSPSQDEKLAWKIPFKGVDIVKCVILA